MILAHVAILAGAPEVNALLFFWVHGVFAAIVGINTVLYTSNADKYAKRLLIWAIISQPVHIWFFGLSLWFIPNILFTLSATVFVVSRFRNIPELLKLPSWAWYALYPSHFIILKGFALFLPFGNPVGN